MNAVSSFARADWEREGEQVSLERRIESWKKTNRARKGMEQDENEVDEVGEEVEEEGVEVEEVEEVDAGLLLFASVRAMRAR